MPPARWMHTCAAFVFVASLGVGVTAWIAAGMSFWWDPDDYGAEYFLQLRGSFLVRGLTLAAWPLVVLAAALVLLVMLRRAPSTARRLACAAGVLATVHLGFTVFWTFEAERVAAHYGEVFSERESPLAIEPEPQPAAVDQWTETPPGEWPPATTSLSAADLRSGVSELRDATVDLLQDPTPNPLVGPLDAEPGVVACVPGGQPGDVPDQTSASGTAYVVSLSVSGPDTVADEQRIIELWQERGLTRDRAMGTNFAHGPVTQAIDQVRMRGDAQGWLNITVTSHCLPDQEGQ
ncbi:hypothetical protein [Pseudoclavibacter helvolus]|uniref:hypothetical protein n=1 Tax=Pseudoclavibacter helvolus TaxID=255205 RepID=UPI003C770347